MIDVDHFFSGTLATVDAVINTFVSTAYDSLIQHNLSVITLLFTLYVMMMGYRFMMHSQAANMSNIMQHLIVMLCVYGMIMDWRWYDLFVYNIFTNEPARLAQVLVNSTGAGINVSNAVDGLYQAVVHATMECLGQVSFSLSGIAFLFYAGLVFIIGGVMCVIALLLFIYAKMMMAVSLALGPIFILFILWAPTKNLFASWLRKLVTLALIPIVTSAVLALMLSVIDVTLPNLTQPMDGLSFQGIAPFLGLSLATALVLSQVLGVCSTLGSGIHLASISHGVQLAKSAFEKSGAAHMARKAGGLATKTRTTSIGRGYSNEKFKG